MIPIANLNSLIVNGVSRFLNPINGNITGTASNVTGTVAIANGGTGATTRLGAAQALTNEAVATPGYVVGLTSNWAKFGYTSIDQLKTTIGSASASSGGTAITMVTTGEKYTWNNKSDLTLGTSSTTALKGDTKYAGASTAGGSATSAVKLDTATAGSATQPCYFANGKPSGCTYSLNKTVPSDAVFTDANVRQYPTDTGNYNYEILFSNGGNNNDDTNLTRKTQYLTYNATYQTLTISNGTTYMNIKGSCDIVLNNTTWDGTNASLKDAITARATILAETIASLTFSSGVATLAKKTGYILINIYPYDRNDNGYGITSFTEQKNGSYQIRNNTTNLNASLAARAIWLKV